MIQYAYENLQNPVGKYEGPQCEPVECCPTPLKEVVAINEKLAAECLEIAVAIGRDLYGELAPLEPSPKHPDCLDGHLIATSDELKRIRNILVAIHNRL